MKKVRLEDLCRKVEKELEERAYSVTYIQEAMAEWAKLEQWCTEEQQQDMTPDMEPSATRSVPLQYIR